VKRYFKLTVIALVVPGSLGIWLWVTDWVTLQGEHTIYTVSCEQGIWDDLRCTGHLVAGDRYRFRASRHRNEVVFWIAGSSAPSGKHVDCRVTSRDDWICNKRDDEQRSIVNGLSNGRPTPSATPGDVQFRAVAKWKWLALREGIPWLSSADYGIVDANAAGK
jgi:hypothetical protein